jgi:GDP-mannose 6-dehydrogenase
MNISIFGLGYVGAVTAGCLSKQGHVIVGVDVHPQKVELFNQGIAPIVEPGLDALLESAKDKGLLRGTTVSSEAVAASELSIVCVGTPSAVTGALDLSFVRQVLKEIGEAVRAKGRGHHLVIRSTMLPGSTTKLVGELLSDLERVPAGGTTPDSNAVENPPSEDTPLLRVYYYPEFLRESTAVADFESPSLAVVGTRDGSNPPEKLMKALFGLNATVVNWQTAEMVKYACNAFHATKITFANEIGRVGKSMGIDARTVMELLCRDSRLNLSSYYLRPGNPFGGSCLPKDVRALTNHARVQGLTLPMIESLLPSNERHLQTLLGLVMASGQTEVAILGLSFKSNTDDLRESAMVEAAQILLGRGYKLRIFDPALNLAGLVGANKRLIDTKMPHLASLLKNELRAALGDGGLIIAAQKVASVAELAKFVTPRHQVLDVNGWPELRQLPCRYEGFCW